MALDKDKEMIAAVAAVAKIVDEEATSMLKRLPGTPKDLKIAQAQLAVNLMETPISMLRKHQMEIAVPTMESQRKTIEETSGT